MGFSIKALLVVINPQFFKLLHHPPRISIKQPSPLQIIVSPALIGLSPVQRSGNLGFLGRGLTWDRKPVHPFGPLLALILPLVLPFLFWVFERHLFLNLFDINIIIGIFCLTELLSESSSPTHSW